MRDFIEISGDIVRPILAFDGLKAHRAVRNPIRIHPR